MNMATNSVNQLNRGVVPHQPGRDGTIPARFKTSNCPCASRYGMDAIAWPLPAARLWSNQDRFDLSTFEDRVQVHPPFRFQHRWRSRAGSASFVRCGDGNRMRRSSHYEQFPALRARPVVSTLSKQSSRSRIDGCAIGRVNALFPRASIKVERPDRCGDGCASLGRLARAHQRRADASRSSNEARQRRKSAESAGKTVQIRHRPGFERPCPRLTGQAQVQIPTG